MSTSVESSLARAAAIVKGSRRLIAFTGAGVSKESGVPTFRGSGGLWERIDQRALEISRFRADPAGSWAVIRELFYGGGRAGAPPEPNAAHRVLAAWEAEGILSFLVTQNIDGLHRAAGSRRIAEFHGSIGELVCQRCGARVDASPEALAAGLLAELPPRCAARVSTTGRGEAPCGGILKPNFVFFGEAIPGAAYEAAFAAAAEADACLVIGSTGVVYPAAEIPLVVARRGGGLVVIDPGETEFSGYAAVELRLGATLAMTRLDELVRGADGDRA